MAKKKGDGDLEEEKCRVNRVAWGTGRVTFRANFATIQEMLDAGWPMSTVYARVKDSLAGVSYRQFTRHVGKNTNAKQSQTRFEKVDKSDAKTEATSVLKQVIQRGSTNDAKANVPGQPARFRPGPRIPDPKDIY